MSLTTLSLMAGSLGSFPPTSGVTVALRSREETRRAALEAEATQPDPHYLRAAMSESIGLYQCVDHHDRMADLRESQRAARKARMARKRRRGWA